MDDAKKYELICKALKQGYIWFHWLQFQVTMFEYNIDSGKFLLTSDTSMKGVGFELEEYGRSWFLKKDKSE